MAEPCQQDDGSKLALQNACVGLTKRGQHSVLTQLPCLLEHRARCNRPLAGRRDRAIVPAAVATHATACTLQTAKFKSDCHECANTSQVEAHKQRNTRLSLELLQVALHCNDCKLRSSSCGEA